MSLHQVVSSSSSTASSTHAAARQLPSFSLLLARSQQHHQQQQQQQQVNHHHHRTSPGHPPVTSTTAPSFPSSRLPRLRPMPERIPPPPVRTASTARRKVSGSFSERPTHHASASLSTASAIAASSGPRLKARVNPAEIVNPSAPSHDAPPRLLRKTPSFTTMSDVGAPPAHHHGGGSRSPLPGSSSRSVMGFPSSAPPLKPRPPVAKAPPSSRGGTSTVGVNNDRYPSTSSKVRTPSALGIGTSSSSPANRSPPNRTPRPRSPTGSSVAGLRNNQRGTPGSANSGMGARFKAALIAQEESPAPAPRVHVRQASTARSALGSGADLHHNDGSPSVRAAAPRPISIINGGGSRLGTEPPKSPRRTPERTQTLPLPTTVSRTPLVSSSLLSPSTLVPFVNLPTPPPLGLGVATSPVTSTDASASASGAANHTRHAPFGSAALVEPEPSSNHSFPVRPSAAALALETSTSPLLPHHQHLFQLHPTASCPTSPIPSSAPLGSPKRASRPPLPWNPHSNPPPKLPLPPGSPEMRTVALPVMTPTRSPELSDEYPLSPDLEPRNGPFPPNGHHRSRRGSESPERADFALGLTSESDRSPRLTMSPPKSPPKSPGPKVMRVERDRLSGSTVHDADDEHGDHDGHDKTMMGHEEALFSDEDKAKVERKIADLEISNASLMAINRHLEASKAKQRSEIIKLRRMLRETNQMPVQSLVRAASRGNAPAAGHSPLARVVSQDDMPDSPVPYGTPTPTGSGGGEASWGDDEMEDPALEARWDRLADLVGAMRRRGERAVEHTVEAKPGVQRVLGWLEVEALGGGGAAGAAGASSAGASVGASAAGSEMGDVGESVAGAADGATDAATLMVGDTPAGL